MQRLPLAAGFGFRAAAQFLSPAGARAKLLVLIYHRVFASVDTLLPDEPYAERFAADMDLLASLFNVLPLGEAVRRLQEGSLPARALCITFDDGYANNLTVAAPILISRNLPATVFVSTGFTGGGRMWNDTLIEMVRVAPTELDLSRFELGAYALTDIAARRVAIDALIGKLKYLEPQARLARVDEIAAHVGRELPNDLMMTETQLRELHAQGIEIGAHTVNHPILTRIDDDRARAEILGSKRRLEEIVGKPITTFAYPNGRPHRDYESRHVTIARDCGFDCAVSTAWGAATRRSDPFQIPRVAPWDRTAARFALRLVKAYVDPAATTV
jgi:peptidoglycan/xylan/chitin deacetylase (PgdA/CDA1 family)